MAKTMHLILRQEVEHLGRPGDSVEVKPGYARNYLLPRKLAVPLTEGNRKVVQQQKASLLRHDATLKADAEQLAAMVGKLTLTLTRKAGESGVLFGSVTTIDLAEQLHKSGYEIDRRKIHLEDPIKQLGEYAVPIRLHREVTVEVPVHVVSETTGSTVPEAAEASATAAETEETSE